MSRGMDATTERFLTTAELIERLKEMGLMKPESKEDVGRVKIRRWMTRENPVPVHRPDGPNGPLYFLWSEVHQWVVGKTCFPPAPGSDDGQAA